MKHLIFNTTTNWAATIIRITLGLTILIHGIGKLSTQGYGDFIYFITEYLNMPIFLGWMTIAIETLGSILLIVGFASRINASMLFGLFIGMIAFVHWDIGFFMNWWGQLDAGQEGFEYHILVLAMSAAITIMGGGAFSIDKRFLSNSPEKKSF
ncbi:MAG: DoxX family protein [Balneola sp.]